MATVNFFTFNPFFENTYVLHDSTGECVIIDAGCYTAVEKNELADFIKSNSLKPVMLLNTHCHIDHVFGNRFVADKYNLLPIYHQNEVPVLNAVANYGPSMGLMVDELPEGKEFLKEGQSISFGNTTLELLFTPGHSPGSISFYNRAEGYLVSGDVLFRQSIGRTDLPGGNFEVLIESIRNVLFTLPDETIVHPGHGELTTIGYEKMYNPFLKS